MHYTRFILTKIHKQRSLNHFFLLDLFLFTLLIFFYQSANSNFRNNILFEVLPKYSSSTPINFSCVRCSIHLFKIQISATFHYTVIGKQHFCVCDFTIITADVITHYIVCLLLPGPQAKLVECFRFTNCNGKANKKRISLHSET